VKWLTVARALAVLLIPCILPMTLTLKLRRVRWSAGSNAANDYTVLDEHSEKIGRIYRTLAVGGGYTWNWLIYGIAIKGRAPAGRERTLEEAQAAFEAAMSTAPVKCD